MQPNNSELLEGLALALDDIRTEIRGVIETRLSTYDAALGEKLTDRFKVANAAIDSAAGAVSRAFDEIDRVRADVHDTKGVLEDKASQDFETVRSVVSSDLVAIRDMVDDKVADSVVVVKKIDQLAESLEETAALTAAHADLEARHSELEGNTAEFVQSTTDSLDTLARGIDRITRDVAGLGDKLPLEGMQQRLVDTADRLTELEEEVRKYPAVVTDALDQLKVGTTDGDEALREYIESVERVVNQNVTTVASTLGELTNKFNAVAGSLAGVDGKINGRFTAVELSVVDATGKLGEAFDTIAAVRAVLDDTTDNAVAVALSLNEVLDKGVATPDDLAGAVGGLHDQIEKVDDKFVEVIDELIEQDDVADRRIASVEGGLKSLSTELRRDLIDHINSIKDGHLQDLSERYGSAEPWLRGSGAYRKDAVVSHLGGLWIAKRVTKVEPSTRVGDDWVLASNGVASIRLAADKRSTTVIVRFTDGTVEEQTVDAPVPNFYKTWEPGKGYEFYDSVMWKNHRWLAIVDEPNGVPGETDDWVLFSMHGARGQKGQTGDQGSRGDTGPQGLTGEAPTMKQIQDEWINYLDDADGVPLFRARGAWKYGTRYSRGEVVSFTLGLYVCLVDNDGRVVPDTVGQTAWGLLLEVQPHGSAGITSSDQSVTTIVTLTQAEYDALNPVSDTTLYLICG